MAQGAATSGDCPGKYDVVIDGKGYMLLQTLEPSLPFRSHRATYSYTATFIERSNVSGSYGDNTQDFFLTEAQSDWSLGEDQRFFRQADVDSIRRYWLGSNIDVSIPGQATIRPTTTSLAFSSAAASCISGPNTTNIFVGSTIDLFEVNNLTVTDRGAHGAGGTVSAICTDGTYVYLSGSACTSTRRYDTNAHTFSSFSGTACSSLCFQNNTLYGVSTGGKVLSFDTAGNPTTLYTFKNAIGGELTLSPSRIIPFGGKVAVLLPFAEASEGCELWLVDASGGSIVAKFPEPFTVHWMIQALGIIFVIGVEANASVGSRTVIYYLANGNLGRLYESAKWYTGSFGNLGIARFQDGLLFPDLATQTLRYYNLSTGGVTSIAPYTQTINTPETIASNQAVVLVTNNTTTGTIITSNAATATSGSVASSLFDFDNTLTKLFRSIKVDYVAATDGNGGSVDVAYQIDGLDGSYTSLVTGATTGVENVLPTNTTGRAISVQVTLNKGTSTAGPILKRVYVRAAPELQSYRNREYVLDLSGIGTHDQVRLADGTYHTLTGHEQSENLNATITKTSAIQISDRFCNLQTSHGGSTTTDSFTAVCDVANCEIYDMREGWDNPQEPGGFVAKITVREI